MPARKPKSASVDAITGLWTIALATFVIAALYFGREILTPLALAALLTFLLSPVVTRLQRWLGRIGAVIVVVVLMFVLVVSAGWVLTRQVVDLGSQLPKYKENIRTKLQSFQIPSGGPLTELSKAFDDLKKDLPGATGGIGDQAAEGIQKLEPQKGNQPIPVNVVSSPSRSPFELFRMIAAPLLGPLGNTAFVLLLMVFMLLKREDLRGRLVRLIGKGHISATTGAMDDAASRVSRYLLMQLIVNVTYGIPFAIGLYFLGIPNAILWGTFAAVLRYIPYVGPWIAAIFPITLSLAVSPDWTTPLLTIGFFILLEVLSNNIMEPWLYGSSTGVSALALIVAAVFWTYIWGPIGLIMATPITVCLAVMGRHIPGLTFLNVILSDEDPLTPAEDCYHRLLRTGGEDELELAESYLKTHTLTDFHDSMLVPALISAGADHRRGLLDADQVDQVQHAVQELIDDIEEGLPGIAKIHGPSEAPPSGAMPPFRVLCLPAKAERDRLAGEMLAQALRRIGIEASVAPGKLTVGERLALAVEDNADVVVVSAIEPTSPGQARYLCAKLRAELPDQTILVGLWGESLVPEAEKPLREAGANLVFKAISETCVALGKLATSPDRKNDPAPIPENDEDRVRSLEALGALDREPDFEPLTAKLTRIFETPMAALSLIDRDTQRFIAHTGLPPSLAKAGQTPRESSICGHIVAADDLIVIEDLARDRRFANNRYIKENKFRFYAGAPIHSPDGQAIGVLCVIDKTPREFAASERRLLNEYAKDVSNQIASAKSA